METKKGGKRKANDETATQQPRPGHYARGKNKGWWSLYRQLGSLLLLCAGARAQPPAADVGPRLTIKVYNYGSVPGDLLSAAEEKATKIFHRAGIETNWWECPLSQQGPSQSLGGAEPSGPLDFVLKILPHSMTERLATDRGSLGFAVLAATTKRGTDAFVFFDRVEKVAELRYTYKGQLLASVIAHEIGHLLLGPGHSRAGIMGALVDGGGNEQRLARFGVLEFMPDQAQHLRAEVLRRVTKQHTSETFDVGSVCWKLHRVGFLPGRGARMLAKKGEAEGGSPVRIHVYNLAGVSKWDLADGEGLATTIFRQARVQLVWLDCALTQAERRTRSGCPALGPMDLTLRILPGSIARRLDMNDMMLGLTPATAETGPGDDAIISYQRVLFVSAASGLRPADLLGVGMAHELGHVLLHSLEHSPRGIMRARSQPDDLKPHNMLNVLFTPEQAEMLRERVLARMKKAGGGQD